MVRPNESKLEERNMNAVPYLALGALLLSSSCMEKTIAIAFGNGSSLVFPRHIFSALNENPQELFSMALVNPEKKQMLSKRLDEWLEKMSEDQKVFTPSL